MAQFQKNLKTAHASQKPLTFKKSKPKDSFLDALATLDFKMSLSDTSNTHKTRNTRNTRNTSNTRNTRNTRYARNASNASNASNAKNTTNANNSYELFNIRYIVIIVIIVIITYVIRYQVRLAHLWVNFRVIFMGALAAKTINTQ